MKSITKAVLIATLSLSATAALADSTFPRSVDDTNPSLISAPRNIATYADRHINDPVGRSAPFPTSVKESPLLTSEFPGIVTYADQHANDPVVRASAPAPASVDENGPLLASEFPGVVTYADQHRNDGLSVRTAQAPRN
jgi:hypothetical protein